MKAYPGLANILAGKKIAVYGIGNNSKMNMELWSKLDIVGFLDGKQLSGFFCEYRIISLEEAMNDNVEVIVIAAEPLSCKIVYDRIADRCRKQKVVLLDLQGNNVEKLYRKICHHKANIKHRKEKLLKMINKFDRVVFEIADVLLTRRILEYETVFDIVNYRAHIDNNDVPDYKISRMRAEKNLFGSIYTVADVYEEMSHISSISKELLVKILKIEEEVEKDLFVVRQEMVDCYKYVSEAGKEIVFITELPFEERFIRNLLETSGLSKFDKLYVSSEIGFSKRGGLYKIVKDDRPDKKTMVIGTDESVDGYLSAFYGMHSFIVDSPKALLNETHLKELTHYISNPNEKSFMGMVCAYLFNSPFQYINNGRAYIKDEKMLSYCFMAPYEAAYMMWLYNSVMNSDVDAVLFGARDGYIFHKMYELMGENRSFRSIPKGYYFYASRLSAITSACNDVEALDEAKKWYGEDVINKMFSTENSREAAEIAKENRKNYVKY